MLATAAGKGRKPFIAPDTTAEEIARRLSLGKPGDTKQLSNATRFVQALKRTYGADSEYVSAAGQ
jgi:hypothetical protein